MQIANGFRGQRYSRAARRLTYVEVRARFDDLPDGETVGVHQLVAVVGAEQQRDSHPEGSDQPGIRGGLPVVEQQGVVGVVDGASACASR